MKLFIQIATLKGISISKEVYMAIIPTSDGEAGIMAAHASFIFKLDNGLVKLYDSRARITEKIFIFGGFAQIYKDTIDMITNKTAKLEDLDTKFAKEQITYLKDKLFHSENEVDIDTIQKQLRMYRKMLEVT